MKSAILRLPMSLVLLACATLGLAPFVPMPHIWEKFMMFLHGVPLQPMDYFDIAFHGAPWALLALKLMLGSTPQD